MISRGTIDNNFSNKNNPLLDNHIKNRKDYKNQWLEFLNQIYDVDPNLPSLPQEMEWIDNVNLDELKYTAEDIRVSIDDVKYTFKNLRGRKSKAPGPNLINY